MLFTLLTVAAYEKKRYFISPISKMTLKGYCQERLNKQNIFLNYTIKRNFAQVTYITVLQQPPTPTPLYAGGL